MATGGQVAAAKVGHYRDTAALCQQGGLVELQGVAYAVKGLRLVAYGLAVCANRLNLRGRHARTGKQLPDDLGVQADQGIGGEGSAMEFVQSRAIEGQKFLPQGLGHGNVR